MAVMIKFTGVVAVVEERESGTGKSGKDWSSQSVVIETGTEQYPNPLKVTYWNDSCKEADGLYVGDEVSVEAYVKGREWNDKYSVKLNGKSLIVTKKAPAPAPTEEEDSPDETEGDLEDMPF